MSTSACRAALLCAALILPAIGARAAGLETVKVRQDAPGTVVVTVRAPDGPPAASAFQLRMTSDGSESRVPASRVTPTSQASDDMSTSVVILIDRSGSMHAVVAPIKRALADVLAVQRPDLRIAVMSFGSSITPLSAFASDARTSLSVVDGISAEGGHDGKTKLYEAMAAASARLANDPSHGPKRLIVISDGKDEGSLVTHDTLASIVQKNHVPIDGIGFGALAPKWSGKLATLATDSGGRFVLADSATALTNALRNDLGTAPVPAYDVWFGYPASSGSAAASNVLLQYDAPELPSALIPIHETIAARATVQTAATPPANQVESPPPPPPGLSTWLDAYVKIGGFAIRMKALLLGLLILLAALLAILLGMRRMHAPAAAAPSPEPPQKAEPRRPAGRAPTMVAAVFGAPAPGRPSAYLMNSSPRGAVTHYPLEKTVTRIGGDAQNDLVIANDSYVSRRHARIRYESHTLYLDDLGSSNGTFRNEVRLGDQPVSLAPGDVLRFGRTSYEVHGAGSEPPQARAADPDAGYEPRVP